MPRPKRTEEEIAAMRQRILDAAVAILHKAGPGSLSIRAIAERVGVSHMVLYSYFENRDELFAVLREQQRQRIHARHADALMRARAGDVRDIVRETLEGYVSFAHNNPRIFRFLWCMSPSLLPELHERPHAAHTPHEGLREELRYLSDLIRLGIERGVLVERDPYLAALMVTSMVNGPLVMYLSPGVIDKETLARLESEAVEASMTYLTGQES